MSAELCRNEDFLTCSQNFTDSLFVNGLALSMIPFGPFRRLGSWIGSVDHRRNLYKAVQTVLPEVSRRMAEEAHEDIKRSRIDAIFWTLELARNAPGEYESYRITLQLLHNLWAGSAAPGGLVTQVVFQILMKPEYLEPLRSESAEVVSRYGSSDQALNSMPLLDSFIREINRLYPTGSGDLLPSPVKV